MQLTIEKQIPLAFSIAGIILIVLGFFAYNNLSALNKSISWEIHTQQVLQKLNETFINLLEAETGTRGFVITGNERFLENTVQAEQINQQNINDLRQLLNDNPAQLERLSNLEKISTEKITFLNEQIEKRRQLGFEGIVPAIKTGRGKVLMQEIRSLADEMKSQETALMRQREEDQQQSFRQAVYLSIIGSAVGVLILLVASWFITKQVALRRSAEQQLQASHQDLENRIENRTRELAETNSNLQIENEKRIEAENRQKIAIEAGKLGIWRYAAESKLYDADERVLELSGVEKEKFDGTAQSLLANVHPDDLPLIKERLAESINEHSPYFTEFRMRGADNSNRWIQAHAQPQQTADGKTVLIGISSDVTASKEASAKLEELFRSEKNARLEAEAANRIRDEFLATVSHELRNPLNAILGWSKMLQNNQLDEKSYEKAVDAVVRNAEAQNLLIGDLLDVSRIIAGKLRLDVAPVNPVEFVEAAIETVRPAADAKEIDLEVSFGSYLNKINGDAGRLQQIVWNLLSNAIKFTPKQGLVKVGVESVNSRIQIEVTDSGIGISKDFLPDVFERFRQEDGSTIRKFGGLGLGLAIVRHLTEMHGGTVNVYSDGENRGSKFIVVLPVSAVSGATEDVTSVSEVEYRAPSHHTNIRLDGLKILTVDDEPDAVQLLSQILSFHGAEVTTAQSVADALDKYERNSFDVIVSDIGMPEQDGYSLAREVRLTNKKSPPVLIALTAFARPSDRIQALTAGFQTHIAKPIEPDELVAVVAGLTDRLPINNSETK